MTRPALRLTSADDVPTPRADDDSALVLDQALDDLARLRTAYWLGDSGVRPHALARLISQAHLTLPAAIDDARDQKLTRTDIAQLLGVSPSTAARLRNRTHEALDKDHPHNAADRAQNPGSRGGTLNIVNLRATRGAYPPPLSTMYEVDQRGAEREHAGGCGAGGGGQTRGPVAGAVSTGREAGDEQDGGEQKRQWV